jgi:hypothetical protein
VKEMSSHEKDHVSAVLRVQVFDGEGVVIYQREQESDSFLKNFLLLLQAGIQGTAVAILDTGNVSRSCLGFSGLVTDYNVTNCSIIVGSGIAPVTPIDYNLQSQITSLQHVPLLISQPTAPVTDGGYIVSKMCERTFNNQTSSEIDVNEIGICVISNGFSILILRDVLGAAVPVLPSQTMQVTYLFRTAI